VITGEKSGKTTITANLNGKITFQKIEIGTDDTYLPDDLILELHLPTNEMHVDSEMPFSVYLKTSDGILVRAPNDIEISLKHEKSLALIHMVLHKFLQGKKQDLLQFQLQLMV